MTIQKFKSIQKDRLFYDRFDYCIGFHLDEVSCLRLLDHDQIDELIERRKLWREIAQQRWVNGRQKHGIIVSRRWKDITEKTATDLHTLAKLLLTTTSEFKLVVSASQAYVYTNDLLLIDQLDNLPELTYKSYTHAQIVRPKNTIRLKNSQYKFRTYFKMSKLTTQQKTQLADFLHNQQGHVRVSPALQTWQKQSFNRIQDYFFVDHSSESWLTMLALVLPGVVRKTMHIITAK